MRILRSVKHKYCADGSFMKEYLLSEPATEEFFKYLAVFGKSESLPGVGGGFLKFEKPDFFSIKGFAGECSVEVRFKKEVMDMTSDFLFFLFSSYKTGEEADLTALKRREKSVEEKVRIHLYGN